MNVFKTPEYEVVRKLRLLDDDLMCKVFDNNIPATELIVNIILGREKTNLLKVIAQKVIKGVNGSHSVTLDIYAVDQEGQHYDIEIQRADKGAAPERARYNSAMIDVNSFEKGHNYTEMKNSYVIFITEKDVLKKNLPVYHIDRVVRETGETFNDGSHILFVNGAYADNETEIGRLMHDFRCVDSSEIRNEILKEKVRFFKEDEKGAVIMCKAVEEYVEKYKEKSHAEGRAEGIAEKAKETAIKMLKEGLDLDLIMRVTELTEDELRELKKTI